MKNKTYTIEEILDYATQPKELEKIKNELNHNKTTKPLFDTSTTVRDLENAYIDIIQTS